MLLQIQNKLNLYDLFTFVFYYKYVYRHDRSKRFKPTGRNPPSLCDLDASSDNTLFQLLHQSNPQASNQEALNDSFANFLDRITGSQAVCNSYLK